MLLTAEQELVVDAIRHYVQREIAPHAAAWDKSHAFPRQALMGLGELENRYLDWAHRRSGGDVSILADALEVSRRTLYRKLREIR